MLSWLDFVEEDVDDDANAVSVADLNMNDRREKEIFFKWMKLWKSDRIEMWHALQRIAIMR